MSPLDSASAGFACLQVPRGDAGRARLRSAETQNGRCGKRQKAIATEPPRSCPPHLERQKPGHHHRVSGQRSHDPPAKPGPRLDFQQQPGHRERETNDATVSPAILPEIACRHRRNGGPGLMERQRETLARDGVEVSGCVPDQRQPARRDPSAALLQRARSAVGREHRRSRQSLLQRRKQSQEIIETRPWTFPEHGHADGSIAHRGYVGLASIVPVHLDQIGPRGDFEVTTQPDSASPRRPAAEPRRFRTRDDRPSAPRYHLPKTGPRSVWKPFSEKPVTCVPQRRLTPRSSARLTSAR